MTVFDNDLVLYFQCCINIIFDRVGRKDPVTRGLEIAVHWCGFDIDLAFWNQHVSFLLVGCIVVTSIRGLLLTLTKVGVSTIVSYYICHFIFICMFFPVFLPYFVKQIKQHYCVDSGTNYGHVLLLLSATDAHEYACRISGDHYRSSRQFALQFLSSLVRCHIPG